MAAQAQSQKFFVAMELFTEGVNAAAGPGKVKEVVCGG